MPNNQMKLRQITKRESANCHIKNRPTVTLKIGQLPHLLLKKWLNLKFNLYLCTKIVKKMEYKKRIADQILADKLEASGAVLIEGPKFCGKTTLIKEGAESLKALSDKIDTTKMKKPSFLMVLTGVGDYAYKRPEDGVLVVPIGCLKE